MKVIYISTPIQDEYTKDPQLIDGRLFYWNTMLIKWRGPFLDEINYLAERGDIEYLLIYDILPVDKYFCDQGCKVGTGCKKDYVENNHALLINCFKIKKNEYTG